MAYPFGHVEQTIDWSIGGRLGTPDMVNIRQQLNGLQKQASASTGS
jgi:hypothetical protein